MRRLVWEFKEARRSKAGPPSFHGSSAISSGALPFGVNLFGYLDTESGVGEIARSMALALRKGGVPHALINVNQKWLRRNDRRFTEFSTSNPYSINLVMVNADQVPAVVREFGETTFAGRINVGYWFWELSQFPSAYLQSFRPFDEIWVASKFCLDAMSAVSPIRVVRVSPGFEFQSPGKRDRASFGIDSDEFIFLYVFDSASSLQRKNPAGTIRAFRDAFPNGGRERLILKTTNATPRQARALQRLAGGSRVTLLTEYLDRDELLDLIASSNAYVSLHRSEGFGLTLLESMAFGKPVIATDYSGSHDFLNSANGFPVGYRLVPLRRTIGPYEKGSVWADPDLKEAARCMRRVREEPSEGKRVGEAARADARKSWSIEASSRLVCERLERLAELP
jgi:glycosyltransferase involved in cell wall biosynthesis